MKKGKPYIQPTVHDAQKIEDEIKTEKDDFLKTATEINFLKTDEEFLW